MDDESRRLRRELARRRTRRQRRVAVAALIGIVGLAGVAASLGGGSGGSGSGERGGDTAKAAQAPPELPRGGRQIFPAYRVVAYYGAPQSPKLGALGIGSPGRAARKLMRQARGYRRGGRPIMPAFELIATIAAAGPGPDGKYRTRQRRGVISRYLKAARRAKALLVLDIQPGQEKFMTEVRALRRFLREPDVSIALDPEWSMAPGQVPGKVIGSTDAATVNRVAAYMAEIVRAGNLPEKLLVVHQFTDGMIRNKNRLERHPGVALTLNVDGFGDRPNKLSKYKLFTRQNKRFFNGFKLFYEEDTNLMRPRNVLRLRPRPDFVVYE